MIARYCMGYNGCTLLVKSIYCKKSHSSLIYKKEQIIEDDLGNRKRTVSIATSNIQGLNSKRREVFQENVKIYTYWQKRRQKAKVTKKIGKYIHFFFFCLCLIRLRTLATSRMYLFCTSFTNIRDLHFLKPVPNGT